MYVYVYFGDERVGNNNSMEPAILLLQQYYYYYYYFAREETHRYTFPSFMHGAQRRLTTRRVCASSCAASARHCASKEVRDVKENKHTYITQMRQDDAEGRGNREKIGYAETRHAHEGGHSRHCFTRCLTRTALYFSHRHVQRTSDTRLSLRIRLSIAQPLRLDT
jgi:hypothetical protein